MWDSISPTTPMTICLVFVTIFAPKFGKALNNQSASSSTFRAMILRHGQTNSNAGGIIQGSSDVSRLTDLGRIQAKQVAFEAFIMNQDHIQDFGRIYCSPLTRAQQTYNVLRDYQAVSKESVPTILPNLREIDFYDWQDQPKDQLKQKYPNAWKAWKVGDPYGLVVPETCSTTGNVVKEHQPLLQLWERADQVWDEIFMDNDLNNVSDYQSALIVAHGSLGQALLGSAMGWDATSFRTHEFPNCGLVEIEWNTCDIISMKDNDNRIRPMASRWRWKHPEKSEWNSYSDSNAVRQTSVKEEFQ